MKGPHLARRTLPSARRLSSENSRDNPQGILNETSWKPLTSYEYIHNRKNECVRTHHEPRQLEKSPAGLKPWPWYLEIETENHCFHMKLRNRTVLCDEGATPTCAGQWAAHPSVMLQAFDGPYPRYLPSFWVTTRRLASTCCGQVSADRTWSSLLPLQGKD